MPDMHILYGNGHILYVGRSYFKRRSVVLESRVSTEVRSEDCAVVLSIDLFTVIAYWLEY